MPAGPMMKCRLAANSAAISRSIISTVRYGEPVVSNGNSTSATTNAAPPSLNQRSGWRRGASGRPVLRLTPCGLPMRPQGRQTSTTAITRNSTTSVSLENDTLKPNMPPTTTTTNAAPMVLRSISSVAGSRGNCNAPPRPASSAPRANTAVNSQAWFTPRALTISRSCVAARTSVPQRVRVSSSHNRPSTTGPTTIRNRSNEGNCRPRMLTEPDSPGARGPLVDAAQQHHLHQSAQRPHHHRRQQQRGPEAQAGAQLGHQRIGHIDADHEERAMRKVDDARDTEDQRQPGAHQEQRGGPRQSVEQLNDKTRKTHSTSFGVTARSIPAGRRLRYGSEIRGSWQGGRPPRPCAAGSRRGAIS